MAVTRVPPVSPCARCASLQRTCCQRADILVTAGDVGRIELSGPEGDFWEWRMPSDPESLLPDEDDPAWLGLTTRPDGTRRLLLRRANGDCILLGPQGCRLTAEVRPLICRLFPFSYTERGIAGEDPHCCPREQLGVGARPMTRVLGMRLVDARRWQAQLYAELRQDPAGEAG